MEPFKIIPYGSKYYQVLMPSFDGQTLYTAFTGDKGQCECFKTHCQARGINNRNALREAVKTDRDLRYQGGLCL